ncbi:hypothetical protein [Cyclobacterium xiamenense]
MRSLDCGSAQSQITTGDLNNYKIFVPSLQVQRVFAMKEKAIHN